MPFELYRPGIGLDVPGYRVEQCRLARAIWSHKTGYDPSVQIQRDVLDCLEASETFAEVGYSQSFACCLG